MSYSCTISFKTINADEIYSFFQQVKKACIDNIESFANWKNQLKRGQKILYLSFGGFT